MYFSCNTCYSYTSVCCSITKTKLCQCFPFIHTNNRALLRLLQLSYEYLFTQSGRKATDLWLFWTPLQNYLHHLCLKICQFAFDCCNLYEYCFMLLTLTFTHSSSELPLLVIFFLMWHLCACLSLSQAIICLWV